MHLKHIHSAFMRAKNLDIVRNLRTLWH